MKTCYTQPSAFFILLFIFIGSSCKKSGASSSQCHTCSTACVIGHFTYPGPVLDTSSTTYCGTGAQITSYEASATTAMINVGGSVYFTNTGPNPANNINVCYVPGQFDSVTYYQGLGYTCN